MIRSSIYGTGSPLVLLHAFPLSHELWQGFQAPAGHQLVLPDFPGFGLSPLHNGDLTLFEAAQGLENHLRSLGLTQPITLGGISMGGYWAFEYLRLFPGRVAKLLLISTRPGTDK